MDHGLWTINLIKNIHKKRNHQAVSNVKIHQNQKDDLI